MAEMTSLSEGIHEGISFFSEQIKLLFHNACRVRISF